MNIYTEDKLCIKVNNRVTNTFIANQGVKQGCILSPLLFNIFLSDLQTKLEKTESAPLLLTRNERIGCLIWADDLLIFSETENGLQNMLNDLGNYAANNGLSVNMTKTKVMIFNKTGRHMRRNFYLNNIKIDTTREYKYLGFLVTPSGEINSGLHDLKDRALRALMKIRNKLGIFFLRYPSVSLKLFDALVKPILLYASDFWGILKLPNNNPIEHLHHNCCKQILGVQKQTSNIGVLLELGQVPLSLYAIKNAIKNWERIAIKRAANGLVIKGYDNGIIENHVWSNRIKSTLTEIGMMESFQDNKPREKTHVKIFQRLCDIFHQNSFANINTESSKLRTYSTFKKDIGCERYLNSIQNTDARISFTKFRLSNHCLMIEKGRHKNIDKNQRFCPFCPSMIEDEVHFLLECKRFESCRKTFLENIYAITREPLPREKMQIFIYLMSREQTTGLTAQYIIDTLQTRELLLK